MALGAVVFPGYPVSGQRAAGCLAVGTSLCYQSLERTVAMSWAARVWLATVDADAMLKALGAAFADVRQIVVARRPPWRVEIHGASVMRGGSVSVRCQGRFLTPDVLRGFLSPVQPRPAHAIDFSTEGEPPPKWEVVRAAVQSASGARAHSRASRLGETMARMEEPPADPPAAIVFKRGERRLTITSTFGIHARPAALVVKTCSGFQSDVELEVEGCKASAKSIMGLMTLELCRGKEFIARATGPDSDQALDALERLVELKFHED